VLSSCDNPDCTDVVQIHRIETELAKQFFLREDRSKFHSRYVFNDAVLMVNFDVLQIHKIKTELAKQLFLREDWSKIHQMYVYNDAVLMVNFTHLER
jgi:hypothetical protein